MGPNLEPANLPTASPIFAPGATPSDKAFPGITAPRAPRAKPSPTVEKNPSFSIPVNLLIICSLLKPALVAPE